MGVTEEDIQQIDSSLRPLVNQPVTGVFHFDDEERDWMIEINDDWDVWIWNCYWRLETSSDPLAASQDDREHIIEMTERLENTTLLSIQVLRPAFETTLTFSGDFTLRLFPAMTDHYTHWGLFTPEKYFLRIGPGTRWSYEADDSAEDS